MLFFYASFEPSISFGQIPERSHFSQCGLRDVQT